VSDALNQDSFSTWSTFFSASFTSGLGFSATGFGYSVLTGDGGVGAAGLAF